MHSRLLLLGLAALIIVSTASATSMDGWFYPGEPFQFEGANYYAFLDNSHSSAILQSNDTRIIVNVGTCENENFIRYCLKGVANQTDLKHIEFDTDNNILYGMHFTVETLGPSLKVSTKYSTTSPDINGRVDGTYTITNDGNQAAEDVTLSYALSDSTHITACSDCEISSSKRGFTKRVTRLAPDEKATISFSFTVDQANDFAGDGNISFGYQGQTGTAKPQHQAFSIKKPYKVALTKATKAPVGDSIDLSFSVTNTGDNPIHVSTSQIKNSSLSYENRRRSDIRSFRELDLDPGESKTYEYSVTSTKAGTYRTGFNVTVTRGSDTFNETVTQGYTWQLQDVTLIARLAKESPASGDQNTLFVTIQNKGTLSFQNLGIDVTGNITENTTISSLGAGKLLEVFKTPITHPKTDTDVTGTINVTLSYETRYGEQQTSTKILDYTVLPLNESYKIRRVMNPKSPAVGEMFTVTVYGTKLADSAVSYTPVTDRLIGAHIEQGNNKLTPIESQKEELLYQYEATRTAEKFAIITSVTASYLKQNATINDTYATFDLTPQDVATAVDRPSNVVTKPSAPENTSTNETAPTNTTPQKNEPAPKPAAPAKEKKSVFTRIVDWFKSLLG